MKYCYCDYIKEMEDDWVDDEMFNTFCDIYSENTFATYFSYVSSLNIVVVNVIIVFLISKLLSYARFKNLI